MTLVKTVLQKNGFTGITEVVKDSSEHMAKGSLSDVDFIYYKDGASNDLLTIKLLIKNQKSMRVNSELFIYNHEEDLEVWLGSVVNYTKRINSRSVVNYAKRIN